jgi:protein-S-isoprenylcysteine O-methyltransferase Ste14
MNTSIERIVSLIVAASVIAVFIAIAMDFIYFNKRDDTEREKRSIVSTGTMVMYYFIYYLTIRNGLSQLAIESKTLRNLLLVIGTVFVVAGAIVNIWGRLQLKNNWANHIKIYENHSLVTTGAYALVRHPLYASIILMLFGGSIVYVNYISAILTAVIFIPFMYYRARQEEVLLNGMFADYSEYKRKTGMFFPKIRRG